MRPNRFIDRPWGVIPERVTIPPSNRWRIRRIQWWIFANCWFSYPPNSGRPKIHNSWAEALNHVNNELKGAS